MSQQISAHRTGLFSAHWQHDDGREGRMGPQGAPIDEALLWARAHAARVYVSLGGIDLWYSAGQVPGDPGTLTWPPEDLHLHVRPSDQPATHQARQHSQWPAIIRIFVRPAARSAWCEQALLRLADRTSICDIKTLERTRREATFAVHVTAGSTSEVVREVTQTLEGATDVTWTLDVGMAGGSLDHSRVEERRQEHRFN